MGPAEAQARSFTYARQRLGRAAPDAAHALADVIGVYSSHPTAPLSLHARAAAMDAADFAALDALRLPAMRASIFLLPRPTAHLAFRALPEPAARSRARLKTFGLTEESYAALREKLLAAAREPRTQAELVDAVGAGAEQVKGASAMLTRTGELVRVGAAGLRSNQLRYMAASVPDADAGEALAWLVGAYLRAFGPVRREDAIWWTGAAAKRVDAALAAHDTADVGDRLLLHTTDVDAFGDAPAPSGVDLLPKWDPYTMGHAPDGRARFADPAVVERCYDFRGDGMPVVLVDGAAAGTWKLATGRAVNVEFDLWERPGKALSAALDARAEAVREFLAS
jgi:hypothetical protein